MAVVPAYRVPLRIAPARPMPVAELVTAEAVLNWMTGELVTVPAEETTTSV